MTRKKKFDHEVILSLTSFPRRFSTLHICIKSLLNQSVKPNRIVLYLDKTVPLKDVPWRVRWLSFFGLEIVNNSENIKPHNKYYNVMRSFPDAIVITVDDDMIYPRSMVSSLIYSYVRHPHAVLARRVHLIKKDVHGVMPYAQWELDCIRENGPSRYLLATGVGGVLYPPHFLDGAAFTTEDIRKYCLNADDIWLKFYEVSSKIDVVYVEDDYLASSIPIDNDIKLCESNLWNGANDIAIQQCERFWGFDLKSIFELPLI